MHHSSLKKYTHTFLKKSSMKVMKLKKSTKDLTKKGLQKSAFTDSS
jgi:hypothetical protein